MIDRVATVIVTTICCSLCTAAISAAPPAPPETGEQAPAAVGLGRPNEQFADLLQSDLFNATIGWQRIPITREITLEGVVRLPFDNSQRRVWGRAELGVYLLDGKSTDENQVTIYIIRPESDEPEIAIGDHYRATGYLRDGFGTASGSTYSFKLSRPMTKVEVAKAGKPPRDVRVTISGKTINQAGRAHLQTADGLFSLKSVSPWIDSMLDKSINVSGIRRSDGQEISQEIEVSSFAFSDLNEMIGQEVELIGETWSLNGKWWFEYAGVEEQIIISQIHKCPGWQSIGHGHRARVRGRLERELRPSLRQISRTRFRELVPQFVIKKAKLENLSAELEPFRFREVYDQAPSFSDGVLNLYDEHPVVYNYMPWMSDSLLLYWRNATLIREIIRRDSPQTRTVLKRRLQDERLSLPLRLLYAGVLAAVNDESGRQYLLTQMKTGKQENLASRMWVIGNLYRFPPIPDSPTTPPEEADEVDPEQAGADPDPTGRIDLTGVLGSLFDAPQSGRPLGDVDMSWAEPLLIEALRPDDRNIKRQGAFSPEPSILTAAENGSFVDLLIKMKSQRGIEIACQRLEEYNTQVTNAGGTDQPNPGVMHDPWPAKIRNRLWGSLAVTDHPRVIKLAKQILKQPGEGSWMRRQAQGYLYPHDRALVIESFIESLDEWYAMKILLQLKPEDVSGPLEAKLPQLEGEARTKGRVLKILLGDNPTAALLKELHKPDCPSRNKVLYWLAQRTNPTVADEMARLLKEAPRDFFNEGELTNSRAVEHAIDACCIEESLDSVRHLISLLDNDFGRFDLDLSYSRFEVRVAERLIELTDVSFGTDKAKWEAWLKAGHPGFKLQRQDADTKLPPAT